MGCSESPRGPRVPFFFSAAFPFLLSPPIRAGGACAAGLDRAVGRCDARRFLLPDLGWLLLRREGTARGRGETSSRRRSQECGPTEIGDRERPPPPTWPSPPSGAGPESLEPRPRGCLAKAA